MTTSEQKTLGQNLATALLLKKSMRKSNRNKTNEQDMPVPSTTTGAHSDERMTYRQAIQGLTPTTNPPTKTVEPSRISYKTKQLEISAFDKKMQDIVRKEEAHKSQAISSWKGFDSMNYGFSFNATVQDNSLQHTLSASSESQTRQLHETSDPYDHESQKSIDQMNRRPSSHRSKTSFSRSASPEQISQTSAGSELRKTNLEHSKTLDNQSRAPSASRSTESAPLRSITPEIVPTPNETRDISKPVVENISPIANVISDSQILQHKNQHLEPTMAPRSVNTHPDMHQYRIKLPGRAYKSIQRSMDRYRFFIW